MTHTEDDAARAIQPRDGDQPRAAEGQASWRSRGLHRGSQEHSSPSQPSEPVNVMLFGKMAFGDLVKCLKVPSQITGVAPQGQVSLDKREEETDTRAEKAMKMEADEEMEPQAKRPVEPPEAGRGQEASPLDPPETTAPLTPMMDTRPPELRGHGFLSSRVPRA